MKKPLNYVGFALLLVALATGSFLVTRTLRTPSAPAEAVVQSPGLPGSSGAIQPASTPAVVVTPVVTPAPAPFIGELNGFTFYDAQKVQPMNLMSSWSPKCSVKGTGNNIRDVSPAEWRGSRLDFTASYLPPGTKETLAVASACEEDIINVAREYTVADMGSISILRQAGPPMVVAQLPREQLVPTVIAGHPAVVLTPTVPKRRTMIVLRDDYSLWKVMTMGLTIDEITKVAEGLR